MTIVLYRRDDTTKATARLSRLDNRWFPDSMAVCRSSRSTSALIEKPLVVPTRHHVLGKWSVVKVHGHEPPKDARRGLKFFQLGEHFWVTWSDGVNEHSAKWNLTRHGEFRTFGVSSTLAGCIHKCGFPSGFGVTKATSLRLTTSARLVFVDDDGNELARYRRVA